MTLQVQQEAGTQLAKNRSSAHMEGDVVRSWKDYSLSSLAGTRNHMEDEEVKVHDRPKGRKMKPTQGRKGMAQCEVLQRAEQL